MKEKIIVLSYFFPPCNLTSAERVFAWSKYMKDADLYPIIITRNWHKPTNNISTSSTTTNEITIEKFDGYEVHSLPYNPSNKDKAFEKFHGTRFYFIYLFLAFSNQISHLFFLRLSPFFIFYNYILKVLKNDSEIKKMIVSASPFELFGIAYKIKKKTPIHWIADYRDDWSTSELYNNHSIKRFLNKINLHFEKKWVKTASFFTTVSDHYLQKINSILHIPGYMIPNGFMPENYHKKFPLFDEFSITYVGSIYPTQPIELFLLGIKDFILSKSSPPKLKVYFIGIKEEVNTLKRFHPFIDEIENYFEFTERIPKSDVIRIQSSSHCLLACAHKNLVGIPSSKLYEYLALEKQVILYPNDHDIIEKTLLDTNQGLICNDSNDFSFQLNRLYNLYEKKEWPKEFGINHTRIKTYSRQFSTMNLAEKIKNIT